MSSSRPAFEPTLLKTAVDTVIPTALPSCRIINTSHGEIVWIVKKTHMSHRVASSGKNTPFRVAMKA